MLGQRRKRCPNNKTTPSPRLFFLMIPTGCESDLPSNHKRRPNAGPTPATLAMNNIRSGAKTVFTSLLYVRLFWLVLLAAFPGNSILRQLPCQLDGHTANIPEATVNATSPGRLPKVMLRHGLWSFPCCYWWLHNALKSALPGCIAQIQSRATNVIVRVQSICFVMCVMFLENRHFLFLYNHNHNNTWTTMLFFT